MLKTLFDYYFDYETLVCGYICCGIFLVWDGRLTERNLGLFAFLVLGTLLRVLYDAHSRDTRHSVLPVHDEPRPQVPCVQPVRRSTAWRIDRGV